MRSAGRASTSLVDELGCVGLEPSRLLVSGPVFFCLLFFDGVCVLAYNRFLARLRTRRRRRRVSPFFASFLVCFLSPFCVNEPPRYLYGCVEFEQRRSSAYDLPCALFDLLRGVRAHSRLFWFPLTFALRAHAFARRSYPRFVASNSAISLHSSVRVRSLVLSRDSGLNLVSFSWFPGYCVAPLPTCFRIRSFRFPARKLASFNWGARPCVRRS